MSPPEADRDITLFQPITGDFGASGPASVSRAALLPILAAPLVALLDAAFGLTQPGPALRGVGAIAAYFTLAASAGAIVGLVLAAVQGLVAGLGARLTPGLRRLLASGGLFALLLILNRNLFAGEGISGHALLPVMVGGGVLAAGVAAWFGPRLVQHLARPGAGARLRGAMLFATALVVVVLNARLHRGRYHDIHLQELLVALALVELALLHWIRDSELDPAANRQRLGVALLAGVLLVPWPALVAETRAFRLGAAGLAARAGWARQLLLPWKSWGLFGESSADRGLLTALSVRDRAGDAARLAAALPERERFNVLLIALDTLRADAVGFLGADPSPSPRLDRLAADSVVFERAVTPYPTSKWAYSAILSGLHPRIAPAVDPLGKLELEFPPGTTLPEMLAERGHRTVGLTAFNRQTATNPSYFGHLARGFEVYNPPWHQRRTTAEAPRMAESAVRAIGAEGEPWFLWLQIMDPHAPYEGPPLPGARDPDNWGAYLGDVARSDAAVGRVLDHLESTGQLDRTVVIVLSDHGEEFREHGFRYHNSNLYEPQVHVPLLVRVPGLAPRRVADTVDLTGVTPTILELLGIEDRLRRTGRSFVPQLLGDPAPGGGFAYAERFAIGGPLVVEQKAAWIGREKAILTPGLGVTEIYDLAADPGEKENLAGLDPERDRRLLGILAAMDELLDEHHDKTTIAEVADAEEFRRRTQTLREAIETDVEKQDEHIAALGGHLFRELGGLSDGATEAHGKDEVLGMVRGLLAKRESLDPGARAVLLRTVVEARLPELLEDLARLHDEETTLKVLPAMGLAYLGDRRGHQTLLDALQKGSHLGIQDAIAVALACIGEPRGSNWIFHSLMSGSSHRIGATILALSRMKVPGTARLLHLRMRGQRLASVDSALAAVAFLSASEEPESTTLLLRLVYDHFSKKVHAAAREELSRRLDPTRLKRELDATTLELEGDLHLKHHRYAEAAAYYRKALEGSGLKRDILALYEVHALRLAERHEAAQQRAQELRERTENVATRLAARNLVKAAEARSPVKLPPSTFRCKVEVPALPKRLRRGMSVARTIEITNQSPHWWTGGPLPFATWVGLLFEDGEGRLHEEDVVFTNWIPLRGVGPGETIKLPLAGRVPPRTGPFRPVVVFRQDWLELPDQGVIHRAER